MKASIVEKKVVAVRAGGVLLVLMCVAAMAVASHSSQWTSALAGGLLLAAGFVVMAPCQLQMAASLTVVIKNLMAKQGEAARPGLVQAAALYFASGYLVFYLPIALGLGALALLLYRFAWILTLVGGLMAIVLGLATLGILRFTLLAKCRGPLWLVRTGRASFQRPFRAGIAFGQYCATCCGPYVYALVVLAGGTAMFWLGSGLVMLYAITMVIPFLLPVLLAPHVYVTVSEQLQARTAQIGQATGYMLVGMGILLVLVASLFMGR